MTEPPNEPAADPTGDQPGESTARSPFQPTVAERTGRHAHGDEAAPARGWVVSADAETQLDRAGDVGTSRHERRLRRAAEEARAQAQVQAQAQVAQARARVAQVRSDGPEPSAPGSVAGVPAAEPADARTELIPRIVDPPAERERDPHDATVLIPVIRDGSAAPSGSPEVESPSSPHPGAAAGPPLPIPEDGAEHEDQVRRWRERSQRRNRRSKWPFWVELPVLLVVAFLLTFLIQTFVAKVYYVPSGSMEQTLHGATSGGDRILVSKVVYDFRDPRQGDVVVFKGPDTWAPEVAIAQPSSWLGKIGQALGSVIGIAPPDEKDFVKRVIAVGGQTVQCCDQQGNIEVNGTSIVEPYIYEPIAFTPGDSSNDCTASADGLRFTSRRCFGPITVPAGQLWVMGDHRSDSSDSSINCQGLTAAGIKDAQDRGGLSCGRPIPVDNVIGKAIFIVMPPSRWGTIGDPNVYQAGSMPAAALPVGGGLLLTAGLRGGLALTPGRRRHRKLRREHGSRRERGRRGPT